MPEKLGLRRDRYLNKTDLINEVAVKTGMTKKDVEKVVNAFFNTVEGTLKEGNKVQYGERKSGQALYQHKKRRSHYYSGRQSYHGL